MSRPKLLIEQWLPIEVIGAECMRERGASSALPPLYFLHVWWARRPLTVSRAAILASLLPAYPMDDDPDARPFPDRFRTLFPTFDAYKAWFIRLVGILGDPVAGKKLIEWAKKENKKLNFNPYGYARAFTINPSEGHLEQLYDLLEWTWGSRDITFCDPMSGGGSIPFEALRYGLTVHANELNPVASVILKATLDYPARFGPSLVDDIRKYGKVWADRVRDRLEPYFPLARPDENIFCYLWARTVACRETGKPVPLSPNWWLRKGTDPMAVNVIADPKADHCHFQIVRGAAACKKANPDKGTVRRGTGVSPWTGDTIDGDYIKAEAQAGRMGQQLYAVGIKRQGDFDFRAPIPEDEAANEFAEREVDRLWPLWEAKGLIPLEPRREGRADWACQIYGATRWCDTYSKRQLLSLITLIEAEEELASAPDFSKSVAESTALSSYLTLALGRAADYNSRQTRWDGTRNKIVNSFARHDLSMRWSFSEFDASLNLVPWIVWQIEDSYSKMTKLVGHEKSMFSGIGCNFENSLCISTGPAQSLNSIKNGAIRCITVDPPYYDNVMYAECSNFFYVWMKRTLGTAFPELFTSELTNDEDEAVMNAARFKSMGKKAQTLATADYENKMFACFKEMNRVLHPDGVLTVMFTHKQVQAWDTLGSSLMRAGFRIDASWPVHTESEASLHQAKKNAAASTILLVCRKREASSEAAWWDDLKGKVKETARETAKRFEDEGIRGVDLYISTFGPVLSIISERWPVLTSNTDPKTGDPIPLQPGEALDLARREVINLRKQGLLLGRSVEFDPVTDWYLMAWDAFRAQEFPADEARKLALALGLDLEAHLVRDKRLVTKKGKNVTLALPAARRKKGMVDTDAEVFPHLIDALHTAMMVYEEDGSKACQVFIDRHGLRNDSRMKALVQAAMQAIPTTRGKDGKFLRPEMTLLDALRLLVWEDLPAPPEEELPVIEKMGLLPGMSGVEDEELGDDEELDEDAEDEESEDE
jgi:adenine-specific DNA methylase